MSAVIMITGRNTRGFNLAGVTTNQTHTDIDLDKILGHVPTYVRDHQQLREQFLQKNNIASNSYTRTNNNCCRKLMSIQPLYKFILICAVLLALTIPMIIILGRGNGFDTRYHKYKNLPATTCLGGPNITDVWYSPPYPFNTTATYAPARATYKTWAFAGKNNSLVPVLGRIPNKLEELGLVDMPCGYCSNRVNYVCSLRSCYCRCRYMLGELEIAIQDLISKSNYTCVVDMGSEDGVKTGEIISLVPSRAMLNRMYRGQITGFAILGVVGTVLLCVLGWLTYLFITLFVLWR